MTDEGRQGAPLQGSIAVTFGTAPDNDIMFDVPVVSGHHASLSWDGATLLLKDLGSTNGTFLGDRRIDLTAVSMGDDIGFGSHRFTLSETHVEKFIAAGIEIPGLTKNDRPPPSRHSTSGKGARHTIMETRPKLPTDTLGSMKMMPRSTEAREAISTLSAGARSINIGYVDDNDVVVPMAQVSSHHCRLWKDGERLVIEDLGSTNGTFVGGERVGRKDVKVGDVIGLGSYRMTIDDTILARFDKPPARTAHATRIAELPPGLLRPIKIGRDTTPGVNDIVIDAPMVSNEHCELTFKGQGWEVRDLGSTNGTYIDSTHNKIKTGFVTESDVLFFGSYRFPMSRLGEFVPGMAGEGSAPDQMRLPEGQEVMVIGRDESCEITINAPQVSRRHARLQRSPEGFTITDLGSANGIFVNGKRVQKATVTTQDVVSLGSYQLRFDAQTGTMARNYHGDLMLQAESVTVKVDRGRKTILHNISFTVYPTEFVGLMGPSGAGKTTLMMALNGYMPPAKGRSLINGTDLYQNYNAFRGNIGYVPQDDIIHRELTVWEALFYTARLRLPPDTRHKEIEGLITNVLQQLEIEDTRDILIGSPEKKGISGGQRKRVNLAQELITQPSLLFLDEPTSGLASEDTINVMKLLRRLADDGRTILLTIHQPSLEAYRTMDNIVYLAEGHLVYYGPAYPDSILYFNPGTRPGTPDGDRILADPGNALKPLAEDKRKGLGMVQRARDYIDSRHFQQYVQRRRTGEGDAVIRGGSKQKVRRRWGLRQWWILSRRYFTIKLKDVANTAILLLQAPIIAIIIALVFRGEMDDAFGRANYAPLALFMMSVSSVWFGCSNAAREIVSEQAIYRRERMVNLKIASYVMSKVTVLGFISAIQCMVLLVLTYLSLGLEGFFFEYYLILYLCAMAGVGMGLMLSAMVRTSEAAIALVPLLLIPQVILAGMIMPIDNLTAPMRVVSAGMMTRWGFEGLLHAEDRGAGFEITEGDIQDKQDELEEESREERKKKKKKGKRSVDAAMPVQVMIPEHPVDRYFKNRDLGTPGDLGILFGFNILMLLGVMAILKIKDPEVG